MNRDQVYQRAVQAACRAVGLRGDEAAADQYRRAFDAAMAQIAVDGWGLISNTDLLALASTKPVEQPATRRCTVTDLLVEQCAHCRPKPATPAREERPRRGPWFVSGYPGECSGCGDEFPAGTEIRADGEGGWLSDCCGHD